ncbi:Hsp20 family protein [Orenia marismortui]|uniref:Heat shock protein Hsp20 n=1 Tax=Orenia marismortui TaxID=46469 RepID=A0A4R8H2X9_9FIRM|nr:Hsp20 family protein [Orenia marismortui]TDX52970.1 heat shock protein Hsp20 [Orenia marismortui]
MFEPLSTRKKELTSNLKSFWNETSFFNNSMDMANIGFETDIKEDNKKYIITANLPGLNKEDISIEADKNYLTISANNERLVKEERKQNHIYRESHISNYQRSFYINNTITSEITAKFDNDILKINIPKKNTSTKHKIDIN